ncbi:hypothetical protein B0H11DRAFT_2213938 [Mycena galericulata]|nr:hypothetical protein B0H11DRAFT_2213938 [Mycena galericulata]
MHPTLSFVVLAIAFLSSTHAVVVRDCKEPIAGITVCDAAAPGPTVAAVKK